MKITQKELKKILQYNASSGLFYWRSSPLNNMKPGDVAGTRRKDGYIMIGYNDTQYFAHRLAWLYVYGEWPAYQIDHDDRNRSNNQISNLKPATNLSNCKNQKRRKNNTSGITGVYWDKRKEKWGVWIGRKYVGYYTSFEEAVKVRKDAEKELNYHPNHGKDLIVSVPKGIK